MLFMIDQVLGEVKPVSLRQPMVRYSVTIQLHTLCIVKNIRDSWTILIHQCLFAKNSLGATTNNFYLWIHDLQAQDDVFEDRDKQRSTLSLLSPEPDPVQRNNIITSHNVNMILLILPSSPSIHSRPFCMLPCDSHSTQSRGSESAVLWSLA